MNKRYRVIFFGLINSEDNFKHGMSRLGVASDSVESIIQKAPVILKEDMRLRDARKYADAVQEAGGMVKIRAHGFFKENDAPAFVYNIEPLENFVMCPQCGYKQLKRETCLRCGSTFLG